MLNSTASAALPSSAVSVPIQGAVPAPSTRYASIPEAEVLSFYLRLNDDQRRARFGGHCSDSAIDKWRATIDKAHYRSVGVWRGHHLVALVELFGCASTGWRQPELATTLAPSTDEAIDWSQVVRLGLAAAKQLQAVDVIVYVDTTDALARTVASRFGGTIDHESGFAVIPCRPLAKELEMWPAVDIAAE